MMDFLRDLINTMKDEAEDEKRELTSFEKGYIEGIKDAYQKVAMRTFIDWIDLDKNWDD